MDLDLHHGLPAILGCVVILASVLTTDDHRAAEAKALDILAVYGASCAFTTIAFLAFCWRAVEAPYND
jgi:hypothetical protein